MRRPISRILLDMDDVCNRFTMHVLKYVGCPVDERDYSQWPVECLGDFNLVKAVNVLLCEERYGLKDFWSALPREVWANVPESDEFAWLLDRCVRLVGRDNICLLSAPTKDPECLAGKLEWIWKHTPEWLHRQYLIGPRKHFCASPEALLIDDSDTNVNKFRAWGGQAILFPRPWNTNYHKWDTVPYLSQQFEMLFERQCIA